MSLLGGLVILGLSLTHGAFFLALKTEGEIRRDSQALGTYLGLGSAVLAVVLLLWLGFTQGTVWTWVTTAVAAVSLLAAIYANVKGREGWAFIGTAVTMASAVATYFLALYPEVMPTTLLGGVSLSIENASSSQLTLQIMTVAALVFTPVVLLYTGLDVLGLPQAARDPAHPEGPSPSGDRSVRPMRPFDPRLLRTAPAARQPVAVLAVVGVLQGVATIGLTFALTALVIAVVEGTSLRGPATWLAVLFAVRAALAWASERVAAWVGVEVTAALRERLLDRWLSAPAEGRPDPDRAVTLAAQGAASVEPYAARFLPALVAGAVVPALAVATLVVGRLGQRRSSCCSPFPCCRSSRPSSGGRPRPRPRGGGRRSRRCRGTSSTSCAACPPSSATAAPSGRSRSSAR